MALTWGPPLQPGAAAAPAPPPGRLGTASEKQQTNAVISLENTQKTSAGDRGQSGRGVQEDLGEELRHVLLGPDDRRDQTVRPAGLGGGKGDGGDASVNQRPEGDILRQQRGTGGHTSSRYSALSSDVCVSPLSSTFSTTERQTGSKSGVCV